MLRSTLSKKGAITLFCSCLIAGIGLCLDGAFRSLLFTMGATAAVGCGTNGLAIQMLFDRIYLFPSYKKIPLPYSGILEIQRKQIAQAIGWVVAKRLVSPQAILRLVTSPNFQAESCKIIREKLLTLAENKELLETLTFELEKTLVALVESEIFRRNLEERIFKHLGKAGIMVMAYEVFRGKQMITPYVQQEMKTVLRNISQDTGFQKQIGKVLENLLEHTSVVDPALKENFQTQGRKILEYMVHQVDIENLVAEEISNFAPGELSGIVLKITAENLDWLEVWGGILGGIGGILFWTVDRLWK